MSLEQNRDFGNLGRLDRFANKFGKIGAGAIGLFLLSGGTVELLHERYASGLPLLVGGVVFGGLYLAEKVDPTYVQDQIDTEFRQLVEQINPNED